MKVRRTAVFDKWLENLKDNQAKIRIYGRITRLVGGNPGDVKPIGEGLSEMRINYGSGCQGQRIKIERQKSWHWHCTTAIPSNRLTSPSA
ncbi:MAG: hypothetical protein LBS82_02185 [Spirochaetaceae bacterium]|nr:hypothetical protein [Spirochaetaceae bacterium]